jgi:hypothetical protein
MYEILFILFVFSGLSFWAGLYIRNYANFKLKGLNKSKFLYPNDFLFDSIPSIFPTVGILLTAAGIVYGLKGFNKDFDKDKIMELLSGIRYSFIATILGLILLLLFQKLTERIKRKIEESENKDNKNFNQNPMEGLKEAISSLGMVNTQLQQSIMQHQTTMVELLNRNTNLIIDTQKEIKTALEVSNNNFLGFSDKSFKELSVTKKNINNKIDTISSRFIKIIEDSSTELTQTQQALKSSINEATVAIIKKFEDSSAEFTQSQNALKSSINETTASIIKKIKDSSSELTETQKALNSSIIETSSKLNEKIEGGLNSITDTQVNLKNVLIESSENIGNNLTEGLQGIQSVQAVFNDTVQERSDTLNGVLQAGFSNLYTNQNEQNERLDSLITENHQRTGTLIGLNEQVLASSLANNEIFETKFTEFITLLQENNTKGLAEAMNKVTEDFNQQMTGLIEKLVQENFSQLNESVQNLNTWQQENKENLNALSAHYQQTTELFSHSSEVLKEVANNTKLLVNDESKLNELIKQLSAIMIDDTKFSSITNKLTQTVELVESSTKLYEETSSKLNKWVVNEYEFKQGVELLIKNLEEFKDFNSGVWDNYRKEMQEAVKIIKETTSSLDNSVENLNSEFYERLSATFENLDNLILTHATKERDE